MPWQIRFQGQLGGSYFEYEERLNSVGLDSDFASGSFAIQVAAEGNFSGLSPHLRLLTQIGGGTEDVSAPTLQQKSDLSIATVLLDVGGGYRFELGESITLIPSLSYTFDFMGFNRTDFEINGTKVILQDLDGKVIDDVGETFVGHGVSPGLAMELEITSIVELQLNALYTFLPEVIVDNDIGGIVKSDGYMVRGGAAVNVRLLRFVALRAGVQVGYQRLENSRSKTRTGSAATATIIFPDSNSFWVVLGVGAEIRF